MKKSKINKEQVYVINQPKHITSSIIVLDNTFPLQEELHQDIERLCEISDVLFVFAPEYFNAQENINYDKFASLYKSCAWIVGGANLNSTILRLISYDNEIFKKHLNFLIINTIGLNRRIDIDKIQAITASSLSQPILEIERLSSNEFFEIYKKNPEEKVNLIDYIKSYIDKGEIKDINRSYSTYKSISKIMFFRKHTIETLLNFFYHDSFAKTYVESFTEDDCSYLFGSILKFLGIENFNRDYETIKL